MALAMLQVEEAGEHKGTKLPEGWALVPLREIARLNERDITIRQVPDDLPVTFVPMAAVDAETGTIAAPQVRPLSKVRRGFTPFSEGDVIFAKITPCMENGKAAIARGLTSGRGFGSTEFHVLGPEDGVLAEWLFYYVRQSRFREEAKANFAGTAGQLRVPIWFLETYELPIAPTSEQRRVVAKIEELFTQLDAGVAALSQVQANLKRYKAAVLKAAFEGKLVPQDPSDEPASVLMERILAERRAKWEADLRAKGKYPSKVRYEEPAPPDTAGLPQLPEGWVWTTLAQVAWNASYGTSQKCTYESAGPPVIRIPNISSGNLDLGDLKYATNAVELKEVAALAPNDLLIIRTNGSKDLIGRSALVRQALDQLCYYASYLIRFRIVGIPGVTAWLSAIWDAQGIRRQIERIAATSAGQYNVSVSSLNKLVAPLPPLEEQHRIVAEVERRLSVVEEVEVVVEANLKRAERLRQAILKQAFEGKLVPQDPSDEPADVLLQRIQAKRDGRRGPTARRAGGLEEARSEASGPEEPSSKYDEYKQYSLPLHD